MKDIMKNLKKYYLHITCNMIYENINHLITSYIKLAKDSMIFIVFDFFRVTPKPRRTSTELLPLSLNNIEGRTMVRLYLVWPNRNITVSYEII